MDKDISHSDRPYTDGQIMPALPDVFQHSYQKKEASGIIRPLFGGFTYTVYFTLLKTGTLYNAIPGF